MLLEVAAPVAHDNPVVMASEAFYSDLTGGSIQHTSGVYVHFNCVLVSVGELNRRIAVGR